MHLPDIRTALIYVVAIVLHTHLLHGQDVYLKGRVTDAFSHKPVAFAHIQNYSIRKATFSDTSGYFIIGVTPGDTLVFSAIGYYYKVAVISDSMVRLRANINYRLYPRIYEIEEARIFAFRNYDEFRNRFLQLDLSQDKTENLRKEIQEQSTRVALEADRKRKEQESLNGVKLLSIPILTPEEKQMIKLKERLAEEKRKDEVYKKYNPELVKKVTGLQEDEEVMEFMKFCDFKDNFILNINEYDLVVIIMKKYEEFLKSKSSNKKGNSSHKPLQIDKLKAMENGLS